MKDFNIAKYLKENNLGPHNILGAYVDLQPLKEEDKNYGEQEAMPEPYEGPEDPIDGLGGELDRDMDASMNEAENHDQMSQEYISWLEKNNLPQMSADELLYKSGVKLTNDQKKYLKMFIDRWEAVEDADVEEMDNSVTGDKGWQYDDEEDSSWMKDDRFAELGGNELKTAIKSLMDDGFEDREIAQFVVDAIRAFKSFKREEVSVSSSGVEMEESLQEVTAWEEKLRYYESEVNDLIHDMIDTTQASSDQVADFFQYISTQVRNQGNF